jgi:hypothetical protein
MNPPAPISEVLVRRDRWIMAASLMLPYRSILALPGQAWPMP